MNRFLLSAFVGFFAFAGAQSVQAQSTTRTAEANPWFADEAPTTEGATYNTGWMSAPGMSLSLHNRPSTDYWGRPLKQKASKKKTVAQAVAAEDVPTYNTGWMSAPGMSLSLHNRPSTDYWGRPLKTTVRRKAASSLSAAPAESSAPVATTYSAQW